MSTSLFETIVQYIVEGRCALFVGPDLGESAGGFHGLPTSWQLADELAALCDYHGRYRPLPQIAQIFENERDRPTLINYLRQRLEVDEYRPLPIHELIARIPFPVIVSCGWDRLLEQALDSQVISYRTVRTDADIPFLRPRENGPLLFKPYGSLDVPDSLVITEEDQLNVFTKLERVVARLKDVVEQYALLLISYAPAQDTVFVRIYHDIRGAQRAYQLPAVAVQSIPREEDAQAWESRGVEAVIKDPVIFLWELAEAVAAAQGRDLMLPDLATISSAPPLTPVELEGQATLLNNMMDKIGVADLVEQTDVPLLSGEQLRDIEAMRAAYERLASSFAPEQESGRVWLRQGNLEYARQNYARAADYYQRALSTGIISAEAYHNLHYVHLAQGNWAEAFEAYQKGMKEHPKLALLPERYEIDTVISGSNIGVVYGALDVQTSQHVAVKILHHAQAQTDHLLHVFQHEAEILKGLDHPNIVRMLDFGSYRGNYFIVMENLEGKTLKEELAQTEQPFSLDRAFKICQQVCDALSYAHSLKIVHRDVKPSNIFLLGDQIKMTDLGLARPVAGRELSSLTSIAGTFNYMAPEQAEGCETDARTDEYAAATVFYEMLTGHTTQGTYRPPSEILPGINGALDIVIEKAREPRPDDRYPTVDEFEAELGRVVSLQSAASKATARHAPAGLRLLAYVAQMSKLGAERFWLAWLGAGIVAGFVVPALWSNVVVRETARYLAAGIFVTWTMTILYIPFTTLLARRTRSAPIIAYGPLLGILLSIVCSILWLRSFSYVYVQPEPRLGYLELIDYLQVIVSALLLSLGTALAMTPALLLAGWLAGRLHRQYADGFFLAFLFLTAYLLIVGIASPCGWFADQSPAPMPPPLSGL
jgi:serine/threonine protein kinase